MYIIEILKNGGSLHNQPKMRFGKNSSYHSMGWKCESIYYIEDAVWALILLNSNTKKLTY